VARARSLSEFQTSFPDETSCAAFLFERRWPEGFVCPACGNGRAASLKSRAHTYECLGCGRQTSSTAGTANVSFETMLGLAAHHHPTSYWDIVGRDNPRKGVPTVRREPRRRRTATGMQAYRSRRPEKVEPSPVSDSTRRP
jgi:predicted RNA-binding Zn-ribbon protein involved in translation (DUF1610 family)